MDTKTTIYIICAIVLFFICWILIRRLLFNKPIIPGISDEHTTLKTTEQPSHLKLVSGYDTFNVQNGEGEKMTTQEMLLNTIYSQVNALNMDDLLTKRSLFFIKLGGRFIKGFNKGPDISTYRVGKFNPGTTAPIYNRDGVTRIDNGCCGAGIPAYDSSFTCPNGTYITEIKTSLDDANTTTKNIIIGCSDGSYSGRLGATSGTPNKNEKTTGYMPSGNIRLDIESSPGANYSLDGTWGTIEHMYIYENGVLKMDNGGNRYPGLNIVKCTPGSKLVGALVRYGTWNTINGMYFYCANEIPEPSLDESRNKFVNTYSAIESYPEDYPVPFMFVYKYKDVFDSGSVYHFDIYDFTGVKRQLNGQVFISYNNDTGKSYIGIDGRGPLTCNLTNISIGVYDTPCELIPVLTPDLAARYLKATYKYINENNKADIVLKNGFCGRDITLPDGTRKLYNDDIARDSSHRPIDPIQKAFESLCACNMNEDFYVNLLCNDDIIKQFGIDPSNPDNKTLIQSIRGTMRCSYPTCSYTLCKNLLGKGPTEYAYDYMCNGVSNCNDCGSSTVCISNQNINIANGATLENSTITAEAKISCGVDKYSPKLVDEGTYKWLDDTKNKIYIPQNCYIETTSVDKTIKRPATNCKSPEGYDVTDYKRIIMDLTNGSGGPKQFNSSTGNSTITISNVNKIDSNVVVDNNIQQLFYEKYKDIYGLPSLPETTINYIDNKIILSYKDQAEIDRQQVISSTKMMDVKDNNSYLWIDDIRLGIPQKCYYVDKTGTLQEITDLSSQGCSRTTTREVMNFSSETLVSNTLNKNTNVRTIILSGIKTPNINDYSINIDATNIPDLLYTRYSNKYNLPSFEDTTIVVKKGTITISFVDQQAVDNQNRIANTKMMDVKDANLYLWMDNNIRIGIPQKCYYLNTDGTLQEITDLNTQGCSKTTTREVMNFASETLVSNTLNKDNNVRTIILSGIKTPNTNNIDINGTNIPTLLYNKYSKSYNLPSFEDTTIAFDKGTITMSFVDQQAIEQQQEQEQKDEEYAQKKSLIIKIIIGILLALIFFYFF